MVKQPSYDLMEVRFDIQEDNNIHQDLPIDIITLNNFSEAPEESIDNPLPIVYGDDWSWLSIREKGAVLSPCIETDKNTKEFYIGKHQVEAPNTGTNGSKVKLYLENIKHYGQLYAPNISYTNNSDGARFILNGDIFYIVNLIPTVKGGQYSSAITDYSNAVDGDNTTKTGAFTAAETFFVKLDKVPTLGSLEYNSGLTIQLILGTEDRTGTSPYGTLQYYNDNWQGGGTKFSTGQNITGASTVYNLKADTSKKGTEVAQADQTFPWTWDDLSGLEFGFTVGAGDSFTVNRIYLAISYIPLVYTRPIAVRSENTTGRRNERRFTPTPARRKRPENISNIFFDLDGGGKEFGAWIDGQGRNTGNTEGDVITCPVYIVESILRDFLGLSDKEIHHQSFDVHGNTTDGTLKDWSFSGGIYEVTNSRDVLDNILQQCKSSLYRDVNGKISFVVNDTVDYTRHNITGSNLLTNNGFETAGEGPGDGSGDVFGTWTEGNNNNTTRKIIRDNTEKSEGTYSCWFDANANDGTTDFHVLQNGIAGVANAPYRLSFDYYFKARTQGIFRFNVYDHDNAVYLVAETSTIITNTDFQTITVDMVMGGTLSTNLQVSFVFENETTGDLYVDNVKFFQVKEYYEFDKDSNIENLKIYETSHDQLINETFINYWLDRGAGHFGKTAFVSSKKKFSGAYLAEDIDISEAAWDVTDDTNFSAGGYIMTDREINLVDAKAANVLTLNPDLPLAAREQFRNSFGGTHDNGSPIFLIEEDSDDGNGSTADTTREAEATEAIAKYNINNKMEIDADWIIDTTTAVALRNYYHDYYTVPHWIIEFDCYLDSSDIQVGSIIRMESTIMDAYLKLGGATWASVDFRIKKFARTGNMDFHIVAEEI